MKIIDEFKMFALRGNAVDLAVGVVVGAAFSNITNSLVKDVITPPLGLLMGGLDFSSLTIPLGGEATLNYGLFIQALVNFIIVAFALFILVRFLNKVALQKKSDSLPQAAKSAELQVLEEIRDAVQKGK